MTAVLYSLPASHTCAAVERALQLKGMPYRRVELIPVAHKLPQKLRFGATTVPVVEFADGKRVVGSRPIVRELEGRAADPPLLPADGDMRARVERAEEWGDQVLQPLVRRVVWAAIVRAPASIDSYTAKAELPIPRPVARLSAPLVSRLAARANGAADPAVRADLVGLRATHLPRVDRWVEDGTLGGAAANAADLQIGSSLALLLSVQDLAPLFDGRPCVELARRWFPEYPAGVTPAGSLPPEWLRPMAT